MRTAFPRGVELLLNESGIVVALLLQQRLLQAEERTWIAGISIEIFAEDFLRSWGVSAQQQRAAQVFPHGIEPVRRFAVVELVLDRDRVAELRDCTGRVFL